MPIPAEYSESQRVQHEIESLGFPLNRHPLDLYRDTLQGLKYVPACRMGEYVKQRITMIGWLITEKSAHTKDGEPMKFVSFEDTTGLYDATLFPAIYRRVCHLLAGDVPYIVGGIVEEEFGAVTLTVTELQIHNAPAKQSCSGPGLTFGS